MRNASQTFVSQIQSIGLGTQVVVPFSQIPPKGPRGGWSTLEEIRIRLNLNITSSGANFLQAFWQLISSIQLNVSDGDGVHGPALVDGMMMRALEAAVTSWTRTRRTASAGEASIGASTANRNITIVIPYNHIGATRTDFARTIVSLQAASAQLVINVASAVPAGSNFTTINAASNLRVEFVLGETPNFIAVPHLRYDFQGIQTLAGGSLRAAAYRQLLLQRVGVNTPFALGDITRFDLSIGGNQLIFNGVPEEWVTFQPAPATNTSNTFIDNPGDATCFFNRIIPTGGSGSLGVTDLPLGQPIYTIGTALTAANLQFLGASITPLTEADIIAQCTAQGASVDQVQSALRAGRWTVMGSRGRRPGDDVKGLLPVVVNI